MCFVRLILSHHIIFYPPQVVSSTSSQEIPLAGSAQSCADVEAAEAMAVEVAGEVTVPPRAWEREDLDEWLQQPQQEKTIPPAPPTRPTSCSISVSYSITPHPTPPHVILSHRTLPYLKHTTPISAHPNPPTPTQSCPHPSPPHTTPHISAHPSSHPTSSQPTHPPPHHTTPHIPPHSSLPSSSQASIVLDDQQRRVVDLACRRASNVFYTGPGQRGVGGYLAG